MKLIVLGLFATFCFAGSPLRSPQLAPITLFTQYQQPAPQGIVDALQEEVASILASVGFHFEWHDLSTSKAAGPAVELAVVTFRGNCDVPGVWQRNSDRPKALGFTSVTDGEILPFTTVDCDRTGGFLAQSLSRLPVNERPAAFGRALGRILAHELFHIFAKTQRHGHGGVAKQAYTVGDLMADEFELEEAECDLLRSSPSYNLLTLPFTR